MATSPLNRKWACPSLREKADFQDIIGLWAKERTACDHTC